MNLAIEKPEGTRRQLKDHLTTKREENILGFSLICPFNIGIRMAPVYVEQLLSMQAREGFSSKQSETSLLVRN